MSVTLDKITRLYAVTLWTGETRNAWAHDAQDAAAQTLALVPTDPETGHGHRVRPGDDGQWFVTFAGDEGTETVATITPLSWDERPYVDGTARALDEDARALAEVGDTYADAVVRADQDARRLLTLALVVAVGVAGYVVGDRYGTPETCDPSTPGCVFVADGVAYRTLSDGIAWPECPQEDSPGPCVWDAQERGDGNGTSFTVDAAGNLSPLD